MTDAPRVDQVVHTFVAADAVSDEARLLRERLRARGFRSTIYALDAETNVAAQVELFEPGVLRGADAIVYHHATAADLGLRLARLPGSKLLIYHGLTPPAFFRPYRPAFAALLERSRAALPRIAAGFARRAADSRYGAGEFRTLCGLDAEVLPFAVDLHRFGELAPTAHRANGLRWLSVGRIAPSKGLHALVAAFAAYAPGDPGATLTLIGRYESGDPYHRALRDAIEAHGVRARVRLTGAVGDAELARAYAASDVYVTLSEHEGFCAPLVEAMAFDLPVIAAANAAIPETLGRAGVLVDPASDAFALAALVAEIAADDALRSALLAAQRSRLTELLPERALEAFDRLVDDLLAR